MGKVVHFEICADDVPRAKQFYETVFDWKIEKQKTNYWAISTDSDPNDPELGGIDGGLVGREGQPPAHDSPVTAYVCTIEVTDMEKTIQKIIEHGGNLVVDRRKAADKGWVCFCKDTEGNMFSILEVDSRS